MRRRNDPNVSLPFFHKAAATPLLFGCVCRIVDVHRLTTSIGSGHAHVYDANRARWDVYGYER